MRKLIYLQFLSIIFAPCFALGAVFDSQSLIKNIYEEKQYLGFAIGNHTSTKALEQMNLFLQTTAAFDDEFRYVIVEGPIDIQNALLQASSNQISLAQMRELISDYWLAPIEGSPQWNFLFNETLVLIRQLNEQRPNNPILMVPIDGYTESWSRVDQQILSDQQNDFLYGGSTTRERATAQSFKNLMASDPDSKALILYHQAHLLKGLNAEGYEFAHNPEEVVMTWGPLGWVGFVSQAQPHFYDKLGVLLFNEVDEAMNPSGIIDMQKLSPFSVGVGMGLLSSQNQPELGAELFMEDSFLRRYRWNTVQFPLNHTKIFDALINY